MVLYHGTQVQNIEALKPFNTRGNAITKPVICFTPNFCIALLYIWNRSYKWVSFEENEEGKVVFTEQYDNMLCDFYDNVSGSIYECNGDNPNITQTHMKGVYVSASPVEVEKETVVLNVYNEILKQEETGNIIVRRYAQLPLKEKEDIFKTTVRAIHMQKLLFATEYQPKQELTLFVKKHFPQAWETASKMTKSEIDQMINEWRTLTRTTKA